MISSKRYDYDNLHLSQYHYYLELYNYHLQQYDPQFNVNVNKVLCLAHPAQIQNRRWTVIVDVFVCVYLYLCICVFVCLYLCICICVFVSADKVVCRAHNRAQIENSSDYSRSCTTTGIVHDFSREPCYAAMCIVTVMIDWLLPMCDDTTMLIAGGRIEKQRINENDSSPWAWAGSAVDEIASAM